MFTALFRFCVKFGMHFVLVPHLRWHPRPLLGSGWIDLSAPERHRNDGKEESVRPTIGHDHRHGGDSGQTAVVTIVYAFVEKRFVPSPAGPIPARSARARFSRWIFRNVSASARVSGAATQSDSEIQTQCMKGKTMTPRELFDSVGRSGIRKIHPGTRWKPRPGERVAGRRIGVPGWGQGG